jgi:hypothetical protein
MNPAELRKAIRNLINKPTPTTTSNPPPQTNLGFPPSQDLFPVFKAHFNSEALNALNIKTSHMLHQYNNVINQHHVLFNTIELLALLGLKSAYNNPCEAMYVREIAKVECFALSCQDYQINQVANELICAINDMALHQCIRASLYNLGLMEVNASSDPNVQDKRYVVYSYLAIDHTKEQFVKSNYGNLMCVEGGMPTEFK